MPGRQNHGRSLLQQPGKPSNKNRSSNKSRSKASATALDAFAIASRTTEPARVTRRERDLEPEQKKKRRRDAGSDDEDDEDEDEDEDADLDDDEDAPQRKRARKSRGDEDDDDDSERSGPEWHVGVESSEDDSDIDSDEAFGDSDEDRFEGFSFPASKQNTRKAGKSKAKGLDSDDEMEYDDDDDSLGEDAIDLADALDQASDDDEMNDEEDSDSGDSISDAESAFSSFSDGDDKNDDSEKATKLRSLITDFSGSVDTKGQTDASASSRQKITLEDLGLSNTKNPLIQKSVKFLKKEERTEAAKKGKSQKLAVPLPRRQQDQLLREAAYEKTNETLDRWTDTVKHNRRADHLFFPLAQTQHDAGLDNSELPVLSAKAAGSELEQSIMAIMEESGLGPSSKQKQRAPKDIADGVEPTISRADLKQVWSDRRKDRETESREQARAKRIKKIKSKTYRRIHRKVRLGEEEAAREEAEGEQNSEDEREAADRRRALERVGARHKESKWGKMAKAGRAVWDEEYRTGLTEMARRDHELRRRVEGKPDESGHGVSDDDKSSLGDDEDEDDDRLLQRLEDIENDSDGGNTSRLFKMKFMQRADAERKKENDALVAEIRRELAGEDGSGDEVSEVEVEVGRRTFGTAPSKSTGAKNEQSEHTLENQPSLSASEKKQAKYSLAPKSKAQPMAASDEAWTKSTQVPSDNLEAWTRAAPKTSSERRQQKETRNMHSKNVELDLTEESFPQSKYAVATKKTEAKPKPTPAQKITSIARPKENNDNDDDDTSSDSDTSSTSPNSHLPLAIRGQRALLARAFAAGDDVIGDFQREKALVADEDDDKVIDATLPGWGSWTGDGISKRAQKRNASKKVLIRKEGVVKKEDRRDGGLERVIIKEGRVKKNDRYLASQLPHPFESRDQYERSLRLPVGPEWMTKQSFQEATKPRVIVKQGIIAPMARPII